MNSKRVDLMRYLAQLHNKGVDTTEVEKRLEEIISSNVSMRLPKVQ